MPQGPLHSTMQRPRGQGWAAFGQKQQQKQGTETAREIDPFPSISNVTPSSTTKYNSASMRSFTSVVRPSLGFQPISGNRKSQIMNGRHDTKHHINQTSRQSDATLVNMLKDIHVWAEQSLIEDVLAAVNNDVDEASVLLKLMVSSNTKLEGPSLSDPGPSFVSCCSKIKKELSGKQDSLKNKLLSGDHEIPVLKSIFSVPIEPEWEEDDVYLMHRKDAVRMMRLASQHSRAASNAFLRGDHISAQQYSLRARDEWMTAEKLNADASREILCIRNSNNDIWKIDLHGLHASEAVSALKEHLQKIESEKILNHSTSSDPITKLEGSISRSVSCDSVHVMEINSDTMRKEIPQQRQRILHVITGMGNHSRGQAAVPAAVRSFLIENGYRFDDARPGVFAVRPKFRNK